MQHSPPKAHKTFTVFDMAMHIARGRQPGSKVQYGAVVYNVFEGQHGFLKRAVAYRRHHLKDHVERVPLLIQSTRLNLAKDVQDLITGIELRASSPRSWCSTPSTARLSAARARTPTWPAT